jgi:hypothetical protein
MMVFNVLLSVGRSARTAAVIRVTRAGVVVLPSRADPAPLAPPVGGGGAAQAAMNTTRTQTLPILTAAQSSFFITEPQNLVFQTLSGGMCTLAMIAARKVKQASR